MAKSTLNFRFLAIFLTILALGGAIGWGIWYWQKVAGPERNFAAGERYLKEEDLRKAVSFFGRAANKQQTNIKYLDALDNALVRLVPATADESREFYNQLIGVRQQRARATPTDAGPWVRAMETLYERNNVFKSDVLWREFGDQAQQISERLAPNDPTQNQFKYWQAISSTRRGSTITEAERINNEKLLSEVVATDPHFDLAWLELMQSQAEGSDKLRSDNRMADANKRLVELDKTIAAAQAALPDGLAWRIGGTMRLNGQLSRREPGITIPMVETAREAVAAMAPKVIGNRDATFLVASELLNARTNEKLREVIKLLQKRVETAPHDMIARRVLMQAATQIDPEVATRVAQETRTMPNLPISLESLIQDEARVVAVTTLFNTAFEQWRAEKEPSVQAIELPKLKALRDEAVKVLEPLGERGTADLIQAKSAIAENRLADAVVLLDNLLKGGSNPPADAYLYAAFANLFRKESGTAMKIATEGIERYPSYTPLLTMRAEIEGSTGKYEQAQRTYQRVLDIDPGNKLAVEGLKNLSGVSTSVATAAVANKHDTAGIALGDAEKLLLKRDVDGAQAVIMESLKTTPNDLRLITAMAQIYVTLSEDPKLANEWIDKGLAINPREERLLQFKAILSSKDPLDRILEAMRLQYPKAETQAIMKYLALLDLRGQLQGAVNNSRSLPELKTGAQNSLDRLNAMLPECFEAALKAGPTEENLLERAALESINAKDWPGVERIAQIADKAGERGIATTLRSRSLLMQDKPDEALNLLLVTRKDGVQAPILLRQLSLLLEREGRIEEAKEAMSAAYERRPNDPTTARLYAMLMDRAGERTRAMEILRELSRANANNREILDAWLTIESQAGDRTGAIAFRRRLYKDMPSFKENSLALANLLLESPADLALMIDAEGKRKFTQEQLQAMVPLKRQQELQQAAQNNLNFGLEIVRLLQEADPTDANLALLKARALARFGKPKDGEDSMRADIAKAGDGNNRALWVSLGAYMAETGRPELAIEPFNEARKQQSAEGHEVDLQIADFWFSRQQWQRAREALEPMFATAPADAQAGIAVRLAEICNNIRDFDAAEKYLDLAEKSLKKSNPTLEMLRAVTLIGRGENAIARGDSAQGTQSYTKAIETYRRATTLAPNNYTAWAGLADAERGMYLRTREPAMLASAEASADKSLSLVRTYLPAIRVKKDLLLDRNDLPAAVALIEGYVRITPQSSDGRRLLIGLLMRGNNAVRAISLAEDAAKMEPANPEWPTMMGEMYQLVGKQDEAVEAFDRAFATSSDENTLMRAVNARLQKTDPDWAGIFTVLRANPKMVALSPPLQGALAAALSNTKQGDAGMQALRNNYANIRDGIAKKNYRPEAWDIWYQSVLQSFKDRPQEAEAFIKTLLGGQPMDMYASRGLARIWRTQGKPGFENAMKYFNEAIAQLKDSPAVASLVLMEAGEMAYTQGECEKSLPLFEQAIALQPNNAPSLNNAAFVAAKCGNAPAKALEWAQKAVELAPQLPDMQDTLGFVFLRIGKPAEALPPLQKAVTMSPTVNTLLHLAQALAETGRKEEARKTLERTRSMQPTAEQTAECDQIEKTLQ